MSAVNSSKRPLEQSADPYMNLKIKGQDGISVYFQIRRSTSLLKALTAYCRKRNMEYKSMEFLYNGERFEAKRSPEDLGMEEEEDEIDALMHQAGGGCVPE